MALTQQYAPDYLFYLKPISKDIADIARYQAFVILPEEAVNGLIEDFQSIPGVASVDGKTNYKGAWGFKVDVLPCWQPETVAASLITELTAKGIPAEKIYIEGVTNA